MAGHFAMDVAEVAITYLSDQEKKNANFTKDLVMDMVKRQRRNNYLAFSCDLAHSGQH